MEELLAMIKMFAGNFAPRGYAFCQGQLLSISQNTALFSLLGTTYGGNGQTTFGLPDLRGRAPIGTGQGPGLSSIILGELSGVENTTLTLQNIPAHNHVITGTVQLPVNGNASDTDSPEASFPGVTSTPTYNTAAAPGQFAGNLNVNLQASISGGSQPFGLRNPYLGMNYVICVEGIYPSRN